MIHRYTSTAIDRQTDRQTVNISVSQSDLTDTPSTVMKAKADAKSSLRDVTKCFNL